MGVPDFHVVISSNLELRLDGLPYSNRRDPSDPGAAVYWRDGDRRLVLACDKWSTVGENLYTIGKTIEATRAIERWGAVTTEQAFAGYTALPERTGPSCWEVLGVAPAATEPEILAAWRSKVKTAHPDAGGSTEAFNALNAAKDIALATLKGR